MAQDKATVQGFVKDGSIGLPSANVKLLGYRGGVVANEDGFYSIEVPANTEVTLQFTFVGYDDQIRTVNLGPGENFILDISMIQRAVTGSTFVVQADRLRGTTLKRLDPKVVTAVPSVSGDLIPSILATQPGVAINNELSSSYSVRGGSFDENLIYVNDIEIYRPFLVRAGQQEGLSFPNGDMVESIYFSAGGFDARYGDKMSSVLDIKYKKPTSNAGTIQGSLLGGSVHFEGASKNYRFTHVSGIRYRTNQYVLNSLETTGDYRPNFRDFQTFLTYDVTTEWELNFLGHYSLNNYTFVPQTRTTRFGTVNEALQLRVFFDGQEVTEFETMTGAFAANYAPEHGKFLLKFIGSAFQTYETETFDILGQYWLDELERDLGSDEFAEVAFNRGVGSFLNHARNTLQARVFSFAHKGFRYREKSETLWGFKIQSEDITDQLSEWNLIDSAGFSIPQAPSNMIILQDVVKADIAINSLRYSGYVQNVWEVERPDTSYVLLTLGARVQHWTYNNQTVFSPRGTISYQPNWKVQKTDGDSTWTQRRDWVFRFATGYYYQPPFYRELRNFQGVLNPEIRAQRSIHFVAGADYQFQAWGRPFKLVTELYYKHLSDLIPYEVDNVRIRYYATNNSEGYAAGIDMKLNGEFIEGIESWASLSVMKTEEDILDDFYFLYLNDEGDTIIPGFSNNDVATDSIEVIPGLIPRNQDQRIRFGLFFQDEMPKWPSYKVHLNLVFGTGLPFGPPTQERYQDVLRTPAYRRVDIGFSKTLIDKNTKFKRTDSKLRHIKNAWVSLEVFNMFGIDNTVSYLWIKDVSNRLYAVPSFLTSRRLNLKFVVRF